MKISKLSRVLTLEFSFRCIAIRFAANREFLWAQLSLPEAKTRTNWTFLKLQERSLLVVLMVDFFIISNSSIIGSLNNTYIEKIVKQDIFLYFC